MIIINIKMTQAWNPSIKTDPSPEHHLLSIRVCNYKKKSWSMFSFKNLFMQYKSKNSLYLCIILIMDLNQYDFSQSLLFDLEDMFEDVEGDNPTQKYDHQMKKGRPAPSRSKDFIPDCSREENLKISIQLAFFTFQQKIGIKKGFVFDEKARVELNDMQRSKKKVPVVNWNEKHYWNEETQRQKAKLAISELRDYEQLKGKSESLARFLVDVGEIFAEEITAEIYEFFTKMIENNLRSTQESIEQLQKKTCQQMMQNCIFLNQKFLTRNIKHKAAKSKPEKIASELKNLQKKLRKSIGEMLI